SSAYAPPPWLAAWVPRTSDTAVGSRSSTHVTTADANPIAATARTCELLHVVFIGPPSNLGRATGPRSCVWRALRHGEDAAVMRQIHDEYVRGFPYAASVAGSPHAAMQSTTTRSIRRPFQRIRD